MKRFLQNGRCFVCFVDLKIYVLILMEIQMSPSVLYMLHVHTSLKGNYSVTHTNTCLMSDIVFTRITRFGININFLCEPIW